MKDDMSRRDFVRRVGLGTIGLGFGVSVFDGVFHYAEALTEEQKHAMLMKGTVNFMGFTAKEITPNEEFYKPLLKQGAGTEWNALRLRIEGTVEKPYSLGFKESEAKRTSTEKSSYPEREESCGRRFHRERPCMGRGQPEKNHRTGLAKKKGIVKTVFYADDGYSDSIPYALSLSGDVFLAFKMNGKPLPREHGYPLRVVVPGIFGMKNVKWLSKQSRQSRLQGILGKRGMVG